MKVVPLSAYHHESCEHEYQGQFNEGRDPKYLQESPIEQNTFLLRKHTLNCAEGLITNQDFSKALPECCCVVQEIFVLNSTENYFSVSILRTKPEIWGD